MRKYINQKEYSNFQINMKITFAKEIDLEKFHMDVGLANAKIDKYVCKAFKGYEPEKIFEWNYLGPEILLKDDVKEIKAFTRIIKDKMNLIISCINDFDGEVNFTIVYNSYNSYGAGLVVPKETISTLARINSNVEFATYYFEKK